MPRGDVRNKNSERYWGISKEKEDVGNKTNRGKNKGVRKQNRI